MTSVHHHPSTDVGLHHVPDWVWIALAALLAVAFGLGIGYIIGNQDATTTEAAATPVAGFEYGQEATSVHLNTGAVTGEYYGNSGELYPALSVAAAATGFDYDQETTPIHLNTGKVTGEYYGNSGELFAGE